MYHPTSTDDVDSHMPLAGGEVQMLAALGAGLTLEAAARQLGISDHAIRRRMRDVCELLSVDTPVQAVDWAAKRGFI